MNRPRYAIATGAAVLIFASACTDEQKDLVNRATGNEPVATTVDPRAPVIIDSQADAFPDVLATCDPASEVRLYVTATELGGRVVAHHDPTACPTTTTAPPAPTTSVAQ